MRPESKKRGFGFVAALALVAAATFCINLFVLRLAFVSGGSMEPTYTAGQPVLVWQAGYSPALGDVVVTGKDNPLGVRLFKRVVALEGQRLQIAGGVVTLDGAVLAEPYLPAGAVTEGEVDCVVPAGHCFLLGDNRAESVDSREIGPVACGDILGKVI